MTALQIDRPRRHARSTHVKIAESFSSPDRITRHFDGRRHPHLAYHHDAAGNRLRITHPDGLYFETVYDALNRPSHLFANGASMIAILYYHPFGGVSAVGHAGTTVHGYDDVQRPLWTLDYFYGGVGNVLRSYGRNPAGQLNKVTRDNDAFAWTGHYAVNRNYTTNGLNQYSAAGSASFQYDDNGNLISDGSRSYVYDIENRLVSASNGAALAYDPLGRLFQVTGGGNTTRFLYDGDALVAEYDGSDALVRRHVHNVGADVPMVTYEGTGLSTPRHLFADHQGSIIARADAAGIPVTINSYDEYGIPGAGNIGRFQYTGQIWLSELGMYHYKARAYSPTLGRFMQTDPIGYDGGFNLYAYAINDPVNRTDPDGTWPDWTHNNMINAAFPGLTAVQRQSVNAGSYYADHGRPEFQAPENSFRHAMRGPGETVAQSRERTGTFVRNQVAAAREAQGGPVRDASAINQGSLQQFGIGAHARMDATSPAHTDAAGNPRPWSADSSIMAHVWQEAWSNNTQFQAGVRELRQLFGATYGQRALQQATTPPPPPPARPYDRCSSNPGSC